MQITICKYLTAVKSVEYCIGDKVYKWSINGRILAKNTILSILVIFMILNSDCRILNGYHGAYIKYLVDYSCKLCNNKHDT